MKKQSADILINLNKIFQNEKEEAKILLDNYLQRITEINYYLNSLHEKEDENYNVFSPRKIESEFKYQVNESSKEREDCLSKVKYYENRLKEINDYIYEIEKIMKLEDLRK